MVVGVKPGVEPSLQSPSCVPRSTTNESLAERETAAVDISNLSSVQASL